VYYEATCMDAGLSRVGWSTFHATYNIGTDTPHMTLDESPILARHPCHSRSALHWHLRPSEATANCESRSFVFKITGKHLSLEVFDAFWREDVFVLLITEGSTVSLINKTHIKTTQISARTHHITPFDLLFRAGFCSRLQTF